MKPLQVGGMGLYHQVHRIDTQLLMAQMTDLQASTWKLWPGQVHLYHKSYPVHPLQLLPLLRPSYPHHPIPMSICGPPPYETIPTTPLPLTSSCQFQLQIPEKHFHLNNFLNLSTTFQTPVTWLTVTGSVRIGKRVPIILPIDFYVKFTDSEKFSLLDYTDPGKGLPSFESLIQALSKNHMRRVVNKSNLELFTTCIKPAVNDALFFFKRPLPSNFPCNFSTFASIASFHTPFQKIIFLQ